MENEMKNYFTQEVLEQMAGMEMSEMYALLKEVEGTRLWYAILKYNQIRSGVIKDSLVILDPIKDPVKIARYQGSVSGMFDLQDVILQLKYESVKSENTTDQAKVMEKIIEEQGGSYSVV